LGPALPRPLAGSETGGGGCFRGIALPDRTGLLAVVGGNPGDCRIRFLSSASGIALLDEEEAIEFVRSDLAVGWREGWDEAEDAVEDDVRLRVRWIVEERG
jgi:hypothetical protein